MSNEIKSFVNGFTQGAGVGLAWRRDQRAEDAENRRDALDPNQSPELAEFDRVNGTGKSKGGLFSRARGAINDVWGSSAPATGGANRVSRLGALGVSGIPAPTVADPAVEWGQGVDAYYQDGGLVTRNAQRRWVEDAQGRLVPLPAPSEETGGAPEANRTFNAYDDPTLDSQRRNMGDDGAYPALPVTGRGDPVYNAPMNAVPENRIIGREGAVPLNDVREDGPQITPSGNSPTSAVPTTEGAVGTGAAPGGKPVGRTVTARKGLRDQSRTEAFDPELDKDDPDNVVSKMLSGGMQFANHAFHLSGDGVAVGDDPNKVKGQRAFLQGVGAAEPADVQALDKIALQQNPDLDKAALAMKRMEIIYRHYVTTGQTDKANKVAFELMQYGAGEAARMGGQALQQFKSGDHKGAVTTLVSAVDAIPDGNTARLGPDGKSVVLTNGKGQTVNSIPITPENIFNYALGLSNKSMYWQVLANRAAITSTAMQKAAQGESRSVLDEARIGLIKARTAKLQGGGGKGGGVSAGLPPALKDALTSIEGVPTSEVTPAGNPPIPEEGGGDTTTTWDGAPARNNSDGSVSTEVSITVTDPKLNGGKPTNIPSMWGGKEVDQDTAIENAIKSKKTWPTFNSIDEAVKAASERSNAKGRGENVGVPYEATGEEDLDGEIPQGDADGVTPRRRSAKTELPTYDEPHPLEKWKGKNPYSEVLANPKFTAYFATKEGKAARSVIEARAREKNKEVAEYGKSKREFERNARKEAETARKDDLAEYKGVHNQKDKSKEAGELFENIKSQYPDVQTEYKDADPSVFNTTIVKPTRIVDTAQSIATSNPNMPPNKALRIVGALTRAGTEEGEEELRSYIVHGTDRLGNMVITPKANPQQKIMLRPETYNDIEEMRMKLHKKLVEDKKKPSTFKKIYDAVATAPKAPPVPPKVKATPRVIGGEGAVDMPPPIAPPADRPINLRIR